MTGRTDDLQIGPVRRMMARKINDLELMVIMKFNMNFDG